MRIKMRTRMAGPNGAFAPGQEIDLPEDEAEQIIQGGYAERLNIPQKEFGNVESTALEEAPERMILPSTKKRKLLGKDKSYRIR